MWCLDFLSCALRRVILSFIALPVFRLKLFPQPHRVKIFSLCENIQESFASVIVELSIWGISNFSPQIVIFFQRLWLIISISHFSGFIFVISILFQAHHFCKILIYKCSLHGNFSRMFLLNEIIKLFFRILPKIVYLCEGKITLCCCQGNGFESNFWK